ncbi:N-acetyl-gamma-glutamyl-phosphate reductase [Sphingomonas sanxanigenens]|uniref:N-acetyl-gamma-glutamyl-phosphate reductase n=1 Tax=Sphingomonas sanxanigenens DSM 19645 = NX02 TaxID=1123269 RepID=W0AC79_9SPHN|nr:N-acetyl-gamma-glutamyl-phosphate reductase [Sphingomonas sanxanigenens]AHE53918.1 hypothetical protein NX02_11030 [Sphingomonas sanxanigenens DSM 19645 = NX02]
MTNLFIDGGAGTTGLEIEARLAGRTDISRIELPEDRRKDAAARREALNEADVAILCLPDDAAREAVALIDNSRTRVIDASTAHRVAPGWTYGFHEIEPDGRARLAAATRVANPGCYPTGFLGLVRPLVAAGLIPADWPISVNAVSGYSGGGKAMIAEFENGDTDTAWRGYALGLAHKHVPEMMSHAGLSVPPLFAPAVVHTLRGMIVEVPLQLAAMPGRPTPAALRAVLEAHYVASPIVRVMPAEALAGLTIEHAAGTDRLDLFLFASPDGGQVRLIAALDNLGKGAAGAAVQSLNILTGQDETRGLTL